MWQHVLGNNSGFSRSSGKIFDLKIQVYPLNEWSHQTANVQQESIVKSLAAMQDNIPHISIDKIDQTQAISFHVQILSRLQLGSI